MTTLTVILVGKILRVAVDDKWLKKSLDLLTEDWLANQRCNNRVSRMLLIREAYGYDLRESFTIVEYWYGHFEAVS